MNAQKDVLYFSVAEAAEILRVSTRVIYRWMKSQKIDYIKVGNTFRIPRQEIFPNAKEKGE